jgi:hypothetical protein
MVGHVSAPVSLTAEASAASNRALPTQRAAALAARVRALRVANPLALGEVAAAVGRPCTPKLVPRYVHGSRGQISVASCHAHSGAVRSLWACISSECYRGRARCNGCSRECVCQLPELRSSGTIHRRDLHERRKRTASGGRCWDRRPPDTPAYSGPTRTLSAPDRGLCCRSRCSRAGAAGATRASRLLAKDPQRALRVSRCIDRRTRAVVSSTLARRAVVSETRGGFDTRDRKCASHSYGRTDYGSGPAGNPGCSSATAARSSSETTASQACPTSEGQSHKAQRSKEGREEGATKESMLMLCRANGSGFSSEGPPPARRTPRPRTRDGLAVYHSVAGPRTPPLSAAYAGLRLLQPKVGRPSARQECDTR